MPVVLIVDDHRPNRILARDVLGAAGFDTLEAATGLEAIDLAVEHVPDVILMDLRLPDMTGVEVARTLFGTARTARIPVVAMSAQPLSGGVWLEEAGFVGSLEKPIQVRMFPAQVRSFCAARTTDPSAPPPC
jgi:two-component system cell cycle response regulator DivK